VLVETKVVPRRGFWRMNLFAVSLGKKLFVFLYWLLTAPHL
jgi:hypothetical protein